MDNLFLNIEFQPCKHHNRPITYYDQENRNPLCDRCSLENRLLLPVKSILNQYQEIIIKHFKENDLLLSELNILKDGIIKYRENFISCLNKAMQKILDQIKCIQEQKQYMQQFDIVKKYASIDDLKTSLNNNLKSNRDVRNQVIMNLMSNLKEKIMNLDFLQIILNQKVKPKQTTEQFQYQLQDKKDAKEELYTFCFNQQNDILIAAGEDGQILTYEFQNGKIERQIKIFRYHSKIVLCLYFMKKTNFLISGSDDHSIKIWSFENNNLIVKQTFVDHQDSILSIIANSKENEIMSGSYDNTVKFWVKSNDVWSLSQSIDVCFKVYALSLNDDDDLLIICGSEKQIKVLKFDQNEKWKIFKVIITNEIGYRLCFTIKNQFVFQPKTDKYLEIYNFDEQIKEFHQKIKIIEYLMSIM